GYWYMKKLVSQKSVHGTRMSASPSVSHSRRMMMRATWLIVELGLWEIMGGVAIGFSAFEVWQCGRRRRDNRYSSHTLGGSCRARRQLHRPYPAPAPDRSAAPSPPPDRGRACPARADTIAPRSSARPCP